MLADTYVDPGSARTLLDAMGGLTGLGLLVAVVGGLIGWGASALIDWLPAPIAILVGGLGLLFLCGIIPA